MINCYAFWQAKLKIVMPYGTLAGHAEKLVRFWHAFGTLARLLARWQVKMTSWHAFGTLARAQVGTWTTLARMAHMARDLENSQFFYIYLTYSFHVFNQISSFKWNLCFRISFFKMTIDDCSPVGNYLFKVNNKNTRTKCEICSKLTMKTPERRHWCRSGL